MNVIKMFAPDFKPRMKVLNDNLNYILSERGIKEGNRITDYYEKFIKPYQNKNCDLLPDINPWEFTVFKTTKKKLDFYYTNSRIDRGFFISDQAKKVLREYNLPFHVVFSNISHFNGIEEKNDLNWISFSKSFGEDINVSKSTYKVDDNDQVDESEYGWKKILKKDIKFSSLEELNSYESELPKHQSVLGENLYVNNIQDFDIVPMFNFTNNTFYFSERLVERIKKEKLSGITFEERFHFNFVID